MIIYNRRNSQNYQLFMNYIKQFGNQFRMKISEPIKHEVTNDRIDEKLRALKSTMDQNPGLQIVVTILESSRDDYYNAIKKTCYCDLAVPSQVINFSSIFFLMFTRGSLKSKISSKDFLEGLTDLWNV